MRTCTHVRKSTYFWVCTKNSSKLKELGSSLSRDFPCLHTRHNFANRLRDKINKAVYCNRILRGSPEMPSGELVGTTLKFTGREVTDGHSHFSNTICKIIVSSARSNDDRARFWWVRYLSYYTAIDWLLKEDLAIPQKNIRGSRDSIQQSNLDGSAYSRSRRTRWRW